MQDEQRVTNLHDKLGPEGLAERRSDTPRRGVGDCLGEFLEIRDESRVRLHGGDVAWRRLGRGCGGFAGLLLVGTRGSLGCTLGWRTIVRLGSGPLGGGAGSGDPSLGESVADLKCGRYKRWSIGGRGNAGV